MMLIYSKHPINSAAWAKRRRGFALAVRLLYTFMINVLVRCISVYQIDSKTV